MFKSKLEADRVVSKTFPQLREEFSKSRNHVFTKKISLKAIVGL